VHLQRQTIDFFHVFLDLTMNYIHIYLALFLFVLCSHIYSYPTTPAPDTSLKDAENEQAVSFWYQVFNNLENEPGQRWIDRYYKRFLRDMALLQRQRRFGNTKYGRRNLLIDEQNESF